MRDTPVAPGEPTFLIMYRPIRHRKRVPDLLSRAFTAGLEVFLTKEDPSDLDIDVPGPHLKVQGVRGKFSGEACASLPALRRVT